MRRAEAGLLTLALVMSVAACGSNASPPTQSEPFQPSADCPLRTLADWQAFLRDAASRPEWSKTCSDLDDCEPQLADFEAQVQSQIVDVFARCESDLGDYPPLARCSSRLRGFVPPWLRQHGSHRYGFDQANDGYFAAQSASDKPPQLMELPQELLAALPDGQAIQQVARAQGWPYLIHDSALGGTRFIFNLPERDGGFERWFVLGVDPATWQVANRSIVSFIGLELPSAEHPRPRPHFRDYVVQAGEGGWSTELPTDFGGKCFACHPNGLRQLLPGAVATTLAAPVRGELQFGSEVDEREFGLQRLAAFNQHISSYPPPDWGASLNTADHGPALGSGQGCTTCHDGNVRAALSIMTSEGTLWQKVVGQLSMGRPSNDQSIPDLPAMALLEREALGPALDKAETADLAAARARHQIDFEQLVQARPTDLERWLLEVPCE